MTVYSPHLVKFVRPDSGADFQEYLSDFLLAPSHWAFGRQVVEIRESTAMTVRKVDGTFWGFLALILTFPISAPMTWAGMKIQSLSKTHHISYLKLSEGCSTGLTIKKKLLFEFVLLYLRIKPIVQRALGQKIHNRFDTVPLGDFQVLLGSLPLDGDAERLIDDYGIDSVLSIVEPFENTSEGWFQKPVTPQEWHVKGARHKQIITPDLEQIDPCKVQEGVEYLKSELNSGRKVLAHCKAGMGRSAIIVIAYLVKHGNMTYEEAYRYLKKYRPQIHLFENQRLYFSSQPCFQR